MGIKAPMELSSVMLSCGAQVGRQVGSNCEQQMAWPGVSWGWTRERGQGQGEVSMLACASGMLGTWTGAGGHVEIAFHY